MYCAEEIVCLGEVCSCGSTVELPLVAEITGVVVLNVRFNGVTIKRDVNLVSGQNITVPNVFNENYKHHIYFETTTGVKYLDTVYSIQVITCLSNSNNEDDMLISIVSVADAGITITDDRMIGRTVTAYVIDDISKNTEFSKPINSNTLTLLGGNTFGQNSVVTIIFQ